MNIDEIVDLMAMAYNQGYKAAIDIMNESTKVASFSNDKIKQDIMKLLQQKVKND